PGSRARVRRAHPADQPARRHRLHPRRSTDQARAGSAAMTQTATAAEPVRTSPSLRLWRIPPAVAVSLLVLLAMAVFAGFGELVAPDDPHRIDIDAIAKPPSMNDWLGTDDLGRDVFSRLIVGTRPALGGALLVAAGAMAAGVLFGLAAGYWG